MGLLSKKKLNKDENELIDPLAGEFSEEEPINILSSDDDQEDKVLGKIYPERKKKGKWFTGRIKHISNYEPTAEELNNIESLYIPHRRMRRLGKRILRLDKLRLSLLLLALLILILFILAMFQEKMGNFTINLDRLELFRKGISISADGNFSDPTARLSADPVINATNISGSDIPSGLNELDGCNNGVDYVAYTYYIRNGGKESVDYVVNLTLDGSSKSAEYAARVAVWNNDEYHIYAEPSSDGTPEDGCENFETHDTVCSFSVKDFQVGYVNRYTVVIWLEGDDPECTDAIVGGSLQFSMGIDTLEENETSLFYKWVEDLKDTISGDRSISAGGTDSPTYEDVTYATRRNSD